MLKLKIDSCNTIDKKTFLKLQKSLKIGDSMI